MSEGTPEQVLSGEARWTVVHGSCLERLKELPDNSVDSIVTDPPYGLGKEPQPVELLTAWLAGDEYLPGKGGFMGRKWDAFVPGPHYWREVLRVLKPGGHALVFAGTRTADLMTLSLRLAGFEIRDELQWMYSTGFPKSHNVSKAIDAKLGEQGEVLREETRPNEPTGLVAVGQGERTLVTRQICAPASAPASAPAKHYHDWGTALKPSHEPIILARKPLDGTIAETVLEHGTGGINIGACRVAHSSPDDLAAHQAQVEAIKSRGGSMEGSWKNSSDLSGASDVSDAGRWPPNTLLVHDPDCQKVGTSEIKAHPTWDTPNRDTQPSSFTGAEVSKVRHGNGKTGEGDTSFAMSPGRKIASETVPVWECVKGCPVKLLGEQSGESKDGVAGKRSGVAHVTLHGLAATNEQWGTYGGSGSAARFFPQFEWTTLDDVSPFKYVAKPSRGERDRGLEMFRARSGGEATNREDDSAGTQNPRAGSGRNGGSRNIHPTTKPVELMRWLCRLITPPNGIVVDPFTGSGTTGIGASLEGFRFLGFELNDSDDEPFVSLARARISHVYGVTLIPREALRGEPPAQVSLFERSA